MISKKKKNDPVREYIYFFSHWDVGYNNNNNNNNNNVPAHLAVEGLVYPVFLFFFQVTFNYSSCI